MRHVGHIHKKKQKVRLIEIEDLDNEYTYIQWIYIQVHH